MEAHRIKAYYDDTLKNMCFSALYKSFLKVSFILTPIFYSHTVSAEVDWVSVVWQNDIVAGTDGGGYTNGMYFSTYDLSTEGKGYTQPFVTRLLNWGLVENGVKFSENVIGQQMVTPKDITQAVPERDDAPYAGLLFYRASHGIANTEKADLITTTLGLVGPDSGAERSQKWVHKITGSEEPEGWEYQLDNQFVFSLARARAWRTLVTKHSDLVLLGKAQVGNLESSVSSGFVFRVGRGLEHDYASALLNHGRMNSPGAINGGWHLYAGVSFYYVFNYLLVDGNTYRDDGSADLKHEQVQATAGASYSWTNVSFTASFNSGSPLDEKETARHSFGTFGLAWRF